MWTKFHSLPPHRGGDRPAGALGREGLRERFKAKMIPPAVSRASACRSEASFAIVCEGFEASRAVDTLLVIAWGGPPFEGYMARRAIRSATERISTTSVSNLTALLGGRQSRAA